MTQSKQSSVDKVEYVAYREKRLWSIIAGIMGLIKYIIFDQVSNR